MNNRQPITLWTDGANYTADRLRRRRWMRFMTAMLWGMVWAMIVSGITYTIYGWFAL